MDYLELKARFLERASDQEASHFRTLEEQLTQGLAMFAAQCSPQYLIEGSYWFARLIRSMLFAQLHSVMANDPHAPQYVTRGYVVRDPLVRNNYAEKFY
jgi:hypothetical protein